MSFSHMLKKLRKEALEKKYSGYKLADFDLFKGEILAESKRVNNKDIEDVVFRIELTYDKNLDILDVK